jgi:hypothetical protein
MMISRPFNVFKFEETSTTTIAAVVVYELAVNSKRNVRISEG